MQWVGERVKERGLADLSVLEVGSQDVNGSVRPFFHKEYIGVDIVEGRGVDICAPAHSLPFDDETFDVVVTTEMLEHDHRFWDSMPEMARVLKPGGTFLLTTRGIGFKYHGSPEHGFADYWRFTQDSIFYLMHDLAGLGQVEITEDPRKGWMAVGVKDA